MKFKTKFLIHLTFITIFFLSAGIIPVITNMDERNTLGFIISMVISCVILIANLALGGKNEYPK